MQKISNMYRTSDGQADYHFSFEEQYDGTWRAYIVSAPSYGVRLVGCHDTHRLPDGDRRYVCWDSAVRSLPDMKAIAAMWANCTQKYIKTGTFPGPAQA